MKGLSFIIQLRISAVLVPILLAGANSVAQAPMPAAFTNPLRTINLENLWDEDRVCENPHKGWYLHYFDNGLKRYNDKLAADDYLEDFPGLNDIYLRLAWSYLEPAEGQFNWRLIDEQIERWTKRGYRISFRISCKEYGDVIYATPQWVERAGAKGKMINLNGTKAWEPDYGDPVFLSKLENFHRAFAKRYDGKEYVEYIDIGSYGDWGEGHTAFSARQEWPASVIIRHLDIHRRNYKKSLLLISDDIIGSRESMDGSREEIMDYLIKNNISLRDDGVSVKWFADRFGKSTLRNPEFFEKFWERLPINLELEHYGNTVREDTWKSGVPFEQAISEAHATYIGFHGYAREWLTENRELANRLANKAGYWFFIRTVVLPTCYTRGGKGYFKIVVLNKGAAPAYRQYQLSVRFRSADGRSFEQKLDEADPRTWMPGRFAEEVHSIDVPADVAAGSYSVEIALRDNSGSEPRFLQLPFVDGAYANGFYKIADIEIR